MDAEARRRVVAWYRAGATLRGIGRKLGVSHETVRAALLKEGEPRRRGRPPNGGHHEQRQ